MAKIHGSYIKEVLEKTKVGEMGIFRAYVVYGIENFNLKNVYKAVVSSDFSGEGGNYYYDNFQEAEKESLSMLKQNHEDFKSEMKELKEQTKQ
jgi:hypothetical protein